ncbi:MAG: GNAT family N-acetyltransferase [Ornithinimicrobium sp.]
MVRPALTQELGEAGSLVARAYLDDELLAPDDPYLSVVQDAAGRARDSVVLVAIDAGVLLGTVTWCPPSSSHREVAEADEGEFRSLGVAAASRGLGVGELLVRECIERAHEEQLTALTISTAASMRAAHRLYERLGFTRVPDKDWSPVRDVCLLAYRLDLQRSPPVRL